MYIYTYCLYLHIHILHTYIHTPMCVYIYTVYTSHVFPISMTSQCLSNVCPTIHAVAIVPLVASVPSSSSKVSMAPSTCAGHWARLQSAASKNHRKMGNSLENHRKMEVYLLVNKQFAVENGPVEIVDLPSYIAWWFSNVNMYLRVMFLDINSMTICEVYPICRQTHRRGHRGIFRCTKWNMENECASQTAWGQLPPKSKRKPVEEAREASWGHASGSGKTDRST